MDGAQIATLLGAGSLAVAGIISAIVAAKIALGKSKVETEQTIRNGVIDEWKEIVGQLQTDLKDCSEEGAANRKELKLQRTEILEMRAQITVRETERVEQRGEIRKLEHTVAELETPDTEALAEAIVPKLAESLLPASPLVPAEGAGPAKVEIVPGPGKPALPVKETP